MPYGRERRENFPMIQRNATEALKLVKHITRACKQVVSSAEEETLSCQAQGTGDNRKGKHRKGKKKK